MVWYVHTRIERYSIVSYINKRRAFDVVAAATVKINLHVAVMVDIHG